MTDFMKLFDCEKQHEISREDMIKRLIYFSDALKVIDYNMRECTRCFINNNDERAYECLGICNVNINSLAADIADLFDKKIK